MSSGLAEIVNLIAFFPFIVISGLVAAGASRAVEMVVSSGPLSNAVFGVTLGTLLILMYTYMNCAFFVDLPFSNPACATLGW